MRKGRPRIRGRPSHSHPACELRTQSLVPRRFTDFTRGVADHVLDLGYCALDDALHALGRFGHPFPGLVEKLVAGIAHELSFLSGRRYGHPDSEAERERDGANADWCILELISEPLRPAARPLLDTL